MKKLSEITNEYKTKLHLCNIEFTDELNETLSNMKFGTHAWKRMNGDTDILYGDNGSEGDMNRKMIYKAFEKIDNFVIEYIWNNENIKFGQGSQYDSFGLVVDDKNDKSWFIIFNIKKYNKTDETYEIWVYDGNKYGRSTHIKNVRYGIFITRSGSVKTKENIGNKEWPERK